MSRKVIILLGTKLLRTFIRVSLNISTWDLISLRFKGFSQLKVLIAMFMAKILAFL